jgi:hypothetical protein
MFVAIIDKALADAMQPGDWTIMGIGSLPVPPTLTARSRAT